MSRDNTIILFHEVIDTSDNLLASILLSGILANDDDHNGSNGEEYNWDITNKNGFECNCEMLQNMIFNMLPVVGLEGVINWLVKFIPTKDAHYTVVDSHWERIDYNLFSVAIVLELEV